MKHAANKFKQALQRRPQQNTVLMNLAVTESMLAEEHVKHQDDAAAEAAFNSALNRYDAALELDPNDFDSLKNRTILATQYARFLGAENPKSFSLLDQSYNALQAQFNQHNTDRTAQLALADALLASWELSANQTDWFTRLNFVLPLLKETLQDGQGRHQAALQDIYYQLVFAGIWAARDQQRAVELARTALRDSAETASQNPHYWPVVLSAAALGLVTTDQWQTQWETSHNAQLEQSVEDWVQAWLALHQQASPSDCPDPIPLLICGRNRIVDDRTVHQLHNADQNLKNAWWWQEFESLVDTSTP